MYFFILVPSGTQIGEGEGSPSLPNSLVESIYLSQESLAYSWERSQQLIFGLYLLISRKVLFICQYPKQKLFSVRCPQIIPYDLR